MLNGAFGVGKTTTALLLQAKLAGSLLYDPEEVGFMLRNIMANSELGPPGDFQHIKGWPEMVVEVAHRLQLTYQCDLVMPMTLAFPAYFKTIKTGLTSFQPRLYHFCLTASPQTIRQRLTERGDRPGGWTFQQMERCLQAFQAPEYAEFIDTDRQKPDQIVKLILNKLDPVNH